MSKFSTVTAAMLVALTLGCSTQSNDAQDEQSKVTPTVTTDTPAPADITADTPKDDPTDGISDEPIDGATDEPATLDCTPCNMLSGTWGFEGGGAIVIAEFERADGRCRAFTQYMGAKQLWANPDMTSACGPLPDDHSSCVQYVDGDTIIVYGTDYSAESNGKRVK